MGYVQYKEISTRVSTIVQEKQAQFEKNRVKFDEAMEEIQQNPLNEDAWAQLAPEAEVARLEAPTSETDVDQNEELIMSDLPDLEVHFSAEKHRYGKASVEESILTIPKKAS